MQLPALVIVIDMGILRHIPQLVVGFLTLRQLLVCLIVHRRIEVVVVRTIVVDMQLAEAVDERQVTVAIDTSDIIGTDGDQVTVIDVSYGDRGVTKDRIGVGNHIVTTLTDVSSGEDGVVDDDTIGVVTPEDLGPVCRRTLLVAQLVEGFHGNIITLGITCAVNGDATGGNHLTVWLDHGTAVTCQTVCYHTVLIIVSATVGRYAINQLVIAYLGSHLLAYGTEHEALVTTGKDVTVVIHHTFFRADLTATDIHGSRAEDIALRAKVCHRDDFRLHVLRSVAAPVVKASATSKDVTKHMTVVKGYAGATALVDLGSSINDRAGRCRCNGCVAVRRSTSDRTDLATAVETASHRTAIHGYV